MEYPKGFPAPVKLYLGDNAPSVFLLPIPLDEGEKFNDFYASSCSAARRVQAERYIKADDRIRCLAAGWLLDHSVRAVSGVGAIEEKDPRGKPTLGNLPELNVSLAHAGKWVVSAIYDTAVGVDLEIEVDVSEGMAELFMSESELRQYRLFRSDAKKRRYFFKIWTMKEAYLKAIGTGLVRSPNLISLDIQDKTLTVEERTETSDNTTALWHCHSSFISEDSYYLSLCWKPATVSSAVARRDYMEYKLLLNKTLPEIPNGSHAYKVAA